MYTAQVNDGIAFCIGNEHPLRFLVTRMRYDMLNPEVPEEQRFKPTHIVTAVKLPTGAVEIAINTENIVDKIDYILSAYDENMKLKANPIISMVNIMVV